jgi:lipoate-protein ligase B
VSTDLSYFDLMVPCGIAEVAMTSVARELDATGNELAALSARTREQVVLGFAAVFSLDVEHISPAALLDQVQRAAG